MTNLILAILRLPFDILMAILNPLTRLSHALLGKLINPIANRMSLTKVGYFDSYFENHSNPLLRGDLYSAALDMYPESRFPTFYKKIPEDLRKHIIVDGRIRGSGYLPAYTLPQGYISNELVNESKQVALRSCLLVLVLSFIAITLGTSYFTFNNTPLTTAMPNFVLPTTSDDWGLFSTVVLLQKVAFYLTAWAAFAAQFIVSLSIALTFIVMPAALFAILLAAITFWGSWRYLIFKTMETYAAPLRKETKESIVRWKYRFETREVEEQAYLAQLNEIERLKEQESDLITIGEATGHFNFRGLLTGPRQHQKVKLAVSDLFQNTIVLGGTGSGKTRSVLLPIISQLIKLQDKQDISLYVTDAKGVLWNDVAVIARKMGRKIQVIGAGIGELGVDLLDGLSPAFVSDIIRSVMRQLGGVAGDSFWPDMASNALRHVFTVLRAWERTDNGIKYAENSGERPYSLASAYRLSQNAYDVNGWMKDIEADILDCIENDFSAIADIAQSDLYASLRYLRTVWPNMAKDTRSGIEANITNALGTFEADVRLREKFASGEQADITIGELWGNKITCVNLPDSEYGAAGKIINVFLKTLLFNEAKRRQAIDPDIANKQQLAFTADEFQSLITADVAGISDATFPNISRSTGLFYLVATQGIVGLEQAIGLQAAANFMNNMRNKIFLQIEESTTMQFARMLAGKAMRFHSFDGDHHESFESMRRESGFDPVLMGAAVLNEDIRKQAGLFTGLFNSCKRYQLSNVTKMFVFSGGVGGSNIFSDSSKSNNGASEERAERNRVEDKNQDYMKSGNEMVDVLSESDLVQMGRTNAYCFIWRSGHSRQDIVRLTDISRLVA